MILVKNLVKTFEGDRGNVYALKGVSFEVPRGQWFTLLGPSGCGKTTNLRCIAGLERPSEGEIVINDRIVFSRVQRKYIPPEHRQIGMVFQSYAIWPHMTVAQNVAYPLVGKNRRKEVLEQRVEAILARVGMGGLGDRLSPNLSGGQQQRVALARALVAEPEILLLDEPLSNLDAKLREQMRVELKGLHETLGITTVYVTHDQEEALAVSDRIGLMSDGRLVEVGSPMDLYNRPSYRLTADFLGTANFIPVQVQNDDTPVWGEMLVESPLGRFRALRSVEWEPGMPAVLFFRPESIESFGRDDRGGDKLNQAQGVVQRVVFLGNAVDILLSCGDQTLRMREHPSRIPRPGDRVHYFVPPSSCIVYPASSSSLKTTEWDGTKARERSAQSMKVTV